MTSKWSGPKLPPGVSPTPKRRSDGTVVWYLYHKATKTRLYGAPGSKELTREAAIAERSAGRVAVERVTLVTICDQFEKSQEHLKKSARTRRAREYYLKLIRDRWGEYEPRHLADRQFRGEIMDWRDELADRPAMADALVAAIQRLMSWAYDRGKIEYDHSKRVGRLAAPKPREGRGITADQEAALLACAEPHERRLYLFALFTLIRQSDLGRVQRGDINAAGWLRWKHTKTAHSSGAIVHLPTHALPALAELLEELPRSNSHPESLLLSMTGKPWSASNIRRAWAAWKIRAKLGDQDIHFHDIRREGINRLFRAGCTEAQASSISGHVFGTGSALEVYADRSAELALDAYHKLAVAMAPPPDGGEKVVQLRR